MSVFLWVIGLDVYEGIVSVDVLTDIDGVVFIELSPFTVVFYLARWLVLKQTILNVLVLISYGDGFCFVEVDGRCVVVPRSCTLLCLES